MSDLLPYYNRELAFLRNMGAEFAKAHPKVAGRIRLSAEHIEDPHTARFIESAAFLNARTQHKLDDDFPELTDGLLSVLYPHYLAPIPSMSIAQLKADSEASGVLQVGRGSELETDRSHGDPCRFRTCFETEVWPLEIESISLEGTPFAAPKSPHAKSCAAVLKIAIRVASPSVSLPALKIRKLRFFLSGQAQFVYPLYETLLNDVVEVAVAEDANDRRPAIFGPEVLQPCGLDETEGMLPYPNRSGTEYRLLTELFAFPTKFQFVEIDLGEDATFQASEGRVEIFCYLSRMRQDLQSHLDESSLVLGCTPIINLFEKRAEPIRISPHEFEYRVVPDSRRIKSHEVYRIDRVSGAGPDGKLREYRPFLGIDHGPHGEATDCFWHAIRKGTEATMQPGFETFVQLVNLGGQATHEDEWVLTAETTCFNKDLPSKLPFGGGQPGLRAGQDMTGVKEIVCLSAPTSTIRPPSGQAAHWRLLSHLSLNYLSLAGEEGAAAFKEILRLYEFASSREMLVLIDAILELECKPKNLRVNFDGQPAYCRGLEISILFDEERFAGSGLFLFCTVLERFLGLYCSINSFVQFTARSNTRDEPLKRWPARAGRMPLI
tara:strand:- start:6029 stop:7846 length:1818 start_codon:yes stop_codon:yes gene_type:complete